LDTAAEEPICAANVSFIDDLRRLVGRMHFQAHLT
jgi:hypothetical protein